MGGAVIMHGDPAPVLEPPEHVLDPAPLPVEGLVVCGIWRYRGKDLSPCRHV